MEALRAHSFKLRFVLCGGGGGGGRGDSGGEEIGGEARLRCLVKLLLGDRVMHTGKFVRGFNE